MLSLWLGYVGGDKIDLDDPGGVGTCWGGAFDGAAAERDAGWGWGLFKRESKAFCLSWAACWGEEDEAGGVAETGSSFKGIAGEIGAEAT
jgi:hypothetical protein